MPKEYFRKIRNRSSDREALSPADSTLHLMRVGKRLVTWSQFSNFHFYKIPMKFEIYVCHQMNLIKTPLSDYHATLPRWSRIAH